MSPIRKANSPVFPSVVIDTREQNPWLFPIGTDFEVGTLKSGDYSVRGFEDRVAIERKSLDDLVGTVTVGRERFLRELERFASYDFAAVVVEADIADVWGGRYVSRATPQSIVGSCAAMMTDYRVPFVFASNPQRAADFALRLLRRWHANHLAKLAEVSA